MFVVLPIVFILLFSSCEAKDPSDTIMFSRTKMLRLVNNARVSGYQCGKQWYAPAKKLQWNDKLEEAAKVHTLDMFENNFFSHQGSNGLSVSKRIEAQHYLWSACGENVSYGAIYEDEVMKELLKSEGHCSNIMNPAFTEMGAWLAGVYWTQVFAKPKE